MPRTLSSTVLAAIAAKTLTVAFFAQLAFADNTLYLYSGVSKIAPAGPPSNPASTFPYGQTFTGLGWLAKLSSIPQTNKIQAQNVTVSLSGIPPSLVSEATAQVRIAGTATIWLGFFDTNANLLTDPVQLFAGALDVPSLTDSGDTSTISITCENTLLSLNLSPSRTFDDSDQQIYHPGDLGMSFVDALANLQLFWPAPDNTVTPYPAYMTITPAGGDVSIGGTLTLTLTIFFWTGSGYSSTSYPVGTTTGFIHCASSNPKVATIDGATGIVTGVSAGACSIIVRVLQLTSTVGGGLLPSSQLRAACSVVVH